MSASLVSTTPAKYPTPNDIAKTHQRQAQPFEVSYMLPSDFSLMLTPSHRRGGNLTTAPIAPLAWPVDPSNEAEALRRLEYSTLQCRAWYDRDATARCIKAVHPTNEEIVGIARCNFFPKEYIMAEHELVGCEEFVPKGTLESEGGRFCLDLWRHVRHFVMSEREKWMAKGEGCWALMSMVTRECYRKQGAASQLVRWGPEKASTDGVPAHLEASTAGKPVYEKCGFQQVGDLDVFDCRRYGKDATFVFAKMGCFPKTS